MGEDPERKLGDGEVQSLKPGGWHGDDGTLWREFAFGHYQAGVDFAGQVAALAEEQNHHPDIHILYKKVRIHYFTHDAGGVTQADLEGARAVNDLFQRPVRLDGQASGRRRKVRASLVGSANQRE